MKKLRGLLTLIGALLCLWYLAAQIGDNWAEFAALDFGAATISALMLATALQTAWVATEAWAWARLLQELGVSADARRGVSIFGVSQFAKYLPGNVLQHLGRIALARDAGWQTGRVTLSLFVENGFALGAAAVVVGLSALMPGATRLWSTERLAATILAAAAAWLLGTLLLQRLLARPPAKVRRLLGLDAQGSGIQLGTRFLGGYFSIHLAGYAVMGVSFALLLRAIGGSWPAGIWMLPAAVTVGWLAGFLVPGAPAGLGVREAALTALLAPSLGAGLVLSAAALWRLSHMLTDLLVFGLGLSLREPRKV
jgi:uncharacterized membrane protein YbhN (UPF0104 family)